MQKGKGFYQIQKIASTVSERIGVGVCRKRREKRTKVL